MHLGIGDGTFGTRTDVSAGSSPFDVQAADLNGDGHLDLFTAEFNGNSVNVVTGDGAGGFSAAQSFPLGERGRRVEAGDFNDDGILDIIAHRNDDVSILIGNGDATFAGAVRLNISDPEDIEIADFNRDGALDFAVARGGPNDVLVKFGAGDGSFPTQINLATPGGAVGLTATDLNGDGLSRHRRSLKQQQLLLRFY